MIGNQNLIRAMNREAILELLRHHAKLTRNQLVEQTGLTVPTVSTILQELKALNWIKEVEDLVTTGGRRAAAFTLNADFEKALAIHVGVHSFSIAVVNLTGRILQYRVKTRCQGSEGNFVEELRQTLREELAVQGNLCGVGISFPGVVDGKKRITLAPNIGGEGEDLAELISDVSDLPLYIDNDARLGALAECWWRPRTQDKNIAYLMADYGVGVGLAFDGKIHAGKNSAAGDIGHAVIDPRGHRCECGQFGCLETFVSYHALARKITEEIHLGRPSSLLPQNEKEPAIETLDHIITAALGGDDVAREAIEEAGRYLAIAVSMLNVILAPDIMFIGGTLSKAYDLLWPSLHEMLSNRGPKLHREGLRIQPATFKEDTSLMGAAALVFQNTLSSFD